MAAHHFAYVRSHIFVDEHYLVLYNQSSTQIRRAVLHSPHSENAAHHKLGKQHCAVDGLACACLIHFVN